MREQAFFRNSLYFTAIVTVCIWSLLAWDYYHGGVPSHHLLAKKEMPAISNWWGGLLIPLLTWFLLSRIKQKVYTSDDDSNSESPNLLRRELYGFLGALVFGGLISVLFTLGQNDIAGNLMLGLFVIAFLFPIHRPECLLGFVLGMVITFGGVLPIIIGTLLGLTFLVLHGILRPAAFYIGSKIAFVASANKRKLNS